MKTLAYAATSATSPLGPLTIDRREPGPADVVIEILYCGVCHSDLHQARNEWKNAIYPMVPGHEIVGRVVRTGAGVKKVKEGDFAAVGCMVDSCRKCASCTAGLEQYCVERPTYTYNAVERGTLKPTFGGYSSAIVVDEAYTLRVPQKDGLAAVAPLLCAGITTWSPLRHWGVKAGKTVGIVGLGGLGHMGVKLARALGAHVVLFTSSENKVADGLRLGAHDVVVTRDPKVFAKEAGRFDFVLDCVSAPHDIGAYLSLLKLDGTLTLVGAPEQPLPVGAFSLLTNRRSLAGSSIGGIQETQEMLEFCAQHAIGSDVETIRIDQINTAYERLQKSDVKYRFVIDMATLKA
ncbi:MAG TPA: NAD(P)-dependent alcohol dehydrogenase [Polyangia bacterium]|nr:NAD(P)-dependent alcohol dehydrogenase [Polyangia bacterium]